MENFLLNNQKKKIRYKDNEIEVYEPTDEQYQELIKIIQENSKVTDEIGIETNVGIKYLRYIFKNLTSLGDLIDRMTDKEILDALDNGNRRIVILYREIEKLITEVLDDIQYHSEQQIKTINSFINILTSNNKKEKINEKIDKLLKQNKVNLTIEEMAELSRLTEDNTNPERLEELLKKSKKITRKRR